MAIWGASRVNTPSAAAAKRKHENEYARSLKLPPAGARVTARTGVKLVVHDNAESLRKASLSE